MTLIVIIGGSASTTTDQTWWGKNSLIIKKAGFSSSGGKKTRVRRSLRALVRCYRSSARDETTIREKTGVFFLPEKTKTYEVGDRRERKSSEQGERFEAIMKERMRREEEERVLCLRS